MILVAAKKPRGQAPYEPTERDRKLVGLSVALGGTQEQIAATLGISSMTLRKYYKKELEHGLYDANLAIGTRLFKKAMDGDTTSCIFWLKCRGGWRETDRLEVTGANGSSMQLEVTHADKRIEETIKNDPETRKILSELYSRTIGNGVKETV